MATFKVTDPNTGKILRLTGDSPPTEAELEQIFAAQRPSAPQQVTQAGNGQVDEAAFDEPSNFLQDVLEVGEAGLSFATKVGADIVGGVTGLATGLISGDSEAAEAVQTGVTEALSFEPRSEGAQEKLQAVGEVLAPVGEALQKAEKFLGDSVFEKTGSPVLSAAAATLPTAILELIGVKGTKTVRNIKKARRVKAIGKEADTLIKESAKSTEELRSISSGVFKEIDELGATVKPEAFRQFANEVRVAIGKEGVDPDVTPGSAKAVRRIQDAIPEVGPIPGDVARPVTLTEIDTLRNVAQNAAGSTTNLRDARLGSMIVDKIDDFIDQADSKVLTAPAGVNVGKRYQVARKLWGQAKRGEMIEEALVKAERAGSSLENNIRTKFRQILDSKSKSKFFSKGELADMDAIVKGSKGANLFTLLGKLGPSDAGKGIIGLSLGITGGSIIAGGAGAVFVPFIGWLSKNQALKMTRGAAEMADAVVRSGRDAKRLAAAYIKHTPKALRDPGEFAALLINGDVPLANLPKSTFMAVAARIAQQRKLALRDVVATGGTALEAREQAKQPTGAQ